MGKYTVKWPFLNANSVAPKFHSLLAYKTNGFWMKKTQQKTKIVFSMKKHEKPLAYGTFWDLEIQGLPFVFCDDRFAL